MKAHFIIFKQYTQFLTLFLTKMSKIYAFIGLVISLIFQSTTAFSQRVCATHDFHNNQLSENPEYLKARKTIESHTKEFISEGNAARMSVTIPVVVHVIWRNGFPTENISDAQVLSQIEVLNQDFRLLNSNASTIPAMFKSMAADCNISFCMAKRTPQNTPTTGINRVQLNRTTNWGTNDDVKNPSAGGYATWNPSKYLNIYVCNIGGGILGYSPYPGAPALNDGIVIDYRYFGTTGIVSSPYHLGRTATHEVGHWLNLNHIWGDSTCGDDDVSDTPTHEEANSGCPSFPHYNSCSGAAEMPMNYMDYSDDGCMNMFTQGQSARMQALFAQGGFRYSLVNSDGCSPASLIADCGAPTLLKANSITSNEATLNWLAVTGANTYTISYKAFGETTWNQANSTTNALKISALQPNSVYQAKVQSNCNTVLSAASNLLTFATTNVPCLAPTNLKITNITDNTATIAWNQNSNITLNTINYRKKGTTAWFSILPTTTSYTLQNLVAGTVYEIQVLAACSNTATAPLNGTFTTTAPLQSCGTPTSVSVNSIGETNATIVWTAVSGATSYRIFFKKSTETNWISNDSGTNNFVLSGLQSSTTYQVKVLSLCNGILGVDSQVLTFATKTIACAITPTNVSISAVTATNASVNWSATTGAASYKLQYRKSNATTWTVIGTIFSTNYNLTNLSATTSYDVQVAAVCGTNATSAFSTQKSFVTVAATPTCTDKYEDNNNKTNAKVLITNTTISANIGYASDNDWFKFSNSASQRYIKLTLSNIPAEYQMRLFDNSGTLIAEATSSSTIAKTIKWNNGKVGSFHIQIFTKNGVFSAKNCYELKVETSANAFKYNTRETADNQPISDDFDVNIAPNPVQEYAKISVSADKNKILDFTMFDLTGKILKTDKFNVEADNNSFFLATDDVQSGIYFLRFQYENKVITKKIIVQK